LLDIKKLLKSIQDAPMWTGILGVVSVVIVVTMVVLIRAMNKEARRSDHQN